MKQSLRYLAMAWLVLVVVTLLAWITTGVWLLHAPAAGAPEWVLVIMGMLVASMICGIFLAETE